MKFFLTPIHKNYPNPTPLPPLPRRHTPINTPSTIAKKAQENGRTLRRLRNSPIINVAFANPRVPLAKPVRVLRAKVVLAKVAAARAVRGNSRAPCASFALRKTVARAGPGGDRYRGSYVHVHTRPLRPPRLRPRRDAERSASFPPSRRGDAETAPWLKWSGGFMHDFDYGCLKNLRGIIEDWMM